MKLIPASAFTIEELTEAYNATRVDYIVPMPMTAARLQEYIVTYDIDLDASCAAVDEEENDLILGIGMLGIRKNRGWISRLGVAPYARRLGAGQAVMDHLLVETKMRDLDWLWLEVIKGNEPAHRLFVRLGFQQTRELMVIRRPPHVLEADELCVNCAPAVFDLTRPEILDQLAQRHLCPNWLNEMESYQHVSLLGGLHITLPHGQGEGWVVYESSMLQLKRVHVEVISGDPGQVSHCALEQLHRRESTKDAVFENLPLDAPTWLGYERLGYFDSFHRLEMVKNMKEPV